MCQVTNKLTKIMVSHAIFIVDFSVHGLNCWCLLGKELPITAAAPYFTVYMTSVLPSYDSYW